MLLTKDDLIGLYRKRARRYDFSANLYYLIGFREARYRRLAVRAMQLRPGDSVVEIGCGTGLNFRYLEPAIGAGGRLTGVDLTDAMLAQARERVNRYQWTNVELVARDAAAYEFPEGTRAVLSTFALTLVPEYEQVIRKAAALGKGTRMVVLDLKLPERWPMWLVRLGVLITRPFGVTLELADRKPWLAMEKYFSRVSVTELYGGFVYLAVAEQD